MSVARSLVQYSCFLSDTFSVPRSCKLLFTGNSQILQLLELGYQDENSERGFVYSLKTGILSEGNVTEERYGLGF